MKMQKKTNFFLAGSVAFGTFFVYLAALQNSFVDWDDSEYVVDNLHIRSIDTAFLKWAFLEFHAANWHPLTWISHALDYAVWGLNPSGHHLTNIVLHAINTFLVILLAISLLQAFQERASGRQSSFLDKRSTLTAAGVTGFLFGLHPLHVESVVWVAERKDLLCGLFVLVSIINYTNCVAGKPVQGGNDRKEGPHWINRYYCSSLGFFFFALLSKPMAVSLPLILLILDWYPLKRFASLKSCPRLFAEKMPFFLLSVASSIITVMAQQAGGAIAPMGVVPLGARLLISAKAVCIYLFKILIPVKLLPFYPYPPTSEISLIKPAYVTAVLSMAAISLVCIVMAKKQKVWLSAWLYYLISLIPVIGIVQVGYQAMADRYMYLPSLGPFLIIGLVIARSFYRIEAQKRLNVRVVGAAAAVLIVGAFVHMDLKQISIWKDSISLWSKVIEEEPEKNAFAYYNRGAAYLKLGQLDMALKDHNRAISLDPTSYEAYNNRGVIYKEMGHPDKALEDLTASLLLNDSNSSAYYNRGIVYGQIGELDKAVADYNRAIQLNPLYSRAYLSRGRTYEKNGKLDRALIDYSTAIEVNPNDPDAYNDRGIVYSLLGDHMRALDDFSAALALDRNFGQAYFNRGRLYLSRGRPELAEPDYRKACQSGYSPGCTQLR